MTEEVMFALILTVVFLAYILLGKEILTLWINFFRGDINLSVLMDLVFLLLMTALYLVATHIGYLMIKGLLGR